MNPEFTLRDQFAMAAITGAATDDAIRRLEDRYTSMQNAAGSPKDAAEQRLRMETATRMARETFASRAYEVADAMMEFRKKESEARNAADIAAE